MQNESFCHIFIKLRKQYAKNLSIIDKNSPARSELALAFLCVRCTAGSHVSSPGGPLGTERSADGGFGTKKMRNTVNEKEYYLS